MESQLYPDKIDIVERDGRVVALSRDSYFVLFRMHLARQAAAGLILHWVDVEIPVGAKPRRIRRPLSKALDGLLPDSATWFMMCKRPDEKFKHWSGFVLTSASHEQVLQVVARALDSSVRWSAEYLPDEGQGLDLKTNPVLRVCVETLAASTLPHCIDDPGVDAMCMTGSLSRELDGLVAEMRKASLVEDTTVGALRREGRQIPALFGPRPGQVSEHDWSDVQHRLILGVLRRFMEFLRDGAWKPDRHLYWLEVVLQDAFTFGTALPGMAALCRTVGHAAVLRPCQGPEAQEASLGFDDGHAASAASGSVGSVVSLLLHVGLRFCGARDARVSFGMEKSSRSRPRGLRLLDHFRRPDGELLGVVVGYAGGLAAGVDARGQLRGLYDRRRDVTFDARSREVSTGNSLPFLVLRAARR